MKKYVERSLVRMMADYILDASSIEFSHDELKQIMKEYALSIPRIKSDITEPYYYQTIIGIKKKLHKSAKKILINIRGRGYKIADDPEKVAETMKQMERAITYNIKSMKIINVINDRHLNKDLKAQKEIMRFHNLGFLDSGKRFLKQLPEPIQKRLKRQIEIPE